MLPYLERVAERNPGYRLTLFLQGFGYQQLGRWPEAEASYRRFLELRPTYAQAWFNLAHGLMSAGRCDEAIGGFEEARRLDPRLDRPVRDWLALAAAPRLRVGPALGGRPVGAAGLAPLVGADRVKRAGQSRQERRVRRRLMCRPDESRSGEPDGSPRFSVSSMKELKVQSFMPGTLLTSSDEPGGSGMRSPRTGTGTS
jgi:tetratricopeptide (TPR) repeat protein